MPAGFQQTHKHCIPKAGYQTNMLEGFEYHFGERISLTYRGFLPKQVDKLSTSQ
jgi:hypothetical protein